MTFEYLTYSDIEQLTGVRKATLRVWVTRGKMPPPDYMPTDKAALWDPKTIETWWKDKDNGSD